MSGKHSNENENAYRRAQILEGELEAARLEHAHDLKRICESEDLNRRLATRVYQLKRRLIDALPRAHAEELIVQWEIDGVKGKEWEL